MNVFFDSVSLSFDKEMNTYKTKNSELCSHKLKNNPSERSHYAPILYHRPLP